MHLQTNLLITFGLEKLLIVVLWAIASFNKFLAWESIYCNANVLHGWNKKKCGYKLEEKTRNCLETEIQFAVVGICWLPFSQICGAFIQCVSLVPHFSFVFLFADYSRFCRVFLFTFKTNSNSSAQPIHWNLMNESHQITHSHSRHKVM